MSDHGPPVAGSNLPFSIRNPRLLAIGFTIYLGSAMALPFITLRKQLKRMYNVNDVSQWALHLEWQCSEETKGVWRSLHRRTKAH